MVEGDDYQWPQSLKANLELLAKLKENDGIRNKVTEEVLKKVEDYITNNLTDFATKEEESGFLPKTIDKSNELRSDIVKSEKLNTFDHYKSAIQDGDADKYTQLLIDNIFPLFGCLYYMYYECSQQCSSIEGGDWWSDKCDGSSGRGKDNLKKWLRDITGKNVKSSDRSSTLMISRGFQEDELSEKTGNALFGDSGSNALLNYKQGAHLQNALYYMLFLPRPDNWDHAQSGHSVLFLEAFCQKVNDGQFQDKYSDNDKTFKSACQKVQQSIKTLTGLNIIVPVASYQEVKYTNLLQPEHFWNYVKWLKDNVTRLMTSLSLMKDDVSKWDKESLKTSTTFGPYPWGFTFAYNGEKKTGQLNGPLNNLISSLKTVNDALENIKPIPPSSTASTVGGVAAGLGAAGAAGAAAYSGLLGPVAEGIGRFFKGLFI